jgi:hypothetical protein
MIVAMWRGSTRINEIFDCCSFSTIANEEKKDNKGGFGFLTLFSYFVFFDYYSLPALSFYPN